MKKNGCLLLSILMLFGLAGCTGGELQNYQGKWFDVNGDTVLDLNGSRMAIDWGGWVDIYYTVHLEKEGTLRYLCGDKDYDFGIMSKLEIRDDGSLRAWEQILDGEGHDYHFVREEQLAAEREIRDESKDLPKTIESREIDVFSLSLRIDGASYGIDEEWPFGQFSWTLDRREDGDYDMGVDVMGPSYIALRYEGIADAAFAEGLANRIAEMDLASLNGYYKTNNVQKHSYSLYVTYTSGERLQIGASGDAADTCPFDVNALMAYVKDIALYEGEKE